MTATADGDGWSTTASGTGPGHRGATLVDETEAFSQFYRDHFAGLVTFLRLLGASYTVAADYVQDAMIKALPPMWGRLHNPRAWCRKTCMQNYLRDVSRRKESLVGDVGTIDSPLIRSESDLVRFEEGVEVMRLLRRLPMRRRQVMACRYDGLTHAEIADELGIDEATSRSIYRQARQEMARLIRAGGGLCDE